MPVCRVVVLLVVVILASPASGSWWETAREGTSRAYWIKSDLPRAELRSYADHLDRMYHEYSTRLASLEVRDDATPRVYIFHRQADYLETLRQQWDIDGRGTGGMFFVNGKGRGLVLWTEGLPERRVQHVIQHEGFHQFAYTRFGGDLPLWVNEGLAEYFGQSLVVGGRLVLGLAPAGPLRSVQHAVEKDEHLPFDRLLMMDSQQWGAAVRGGSASLQYAQSWAVVKFLVDGVDRKYRPHFEQYLRMINEGRSAREAFDVVFGPNLGPFESAWREAILAQRPSPFLAALDRIEFLAEGALQLSRTGQRPETLDALRDGLRAADFTWTTAMHGLTTEITSADDASFLIPAEAEGAAATFVLDLPKRRPPPRKWREREAAEPMPARIRTVGLTPRDLEVRWERDRTTGALGYRVDVK